MANTIKSISFNGRDDVKKVTINGGIYWEKAAVHATMTVKMTSGVVPTYTGWTASLVSAAADGDVYTLTKDDTAKPTSYDFSTNMSGLNTELLEVIEMAVDENVTRLSNCFKGCAKLTAVNTTYTNTSGVTVSWDVSNITTIKNAFQGCSSLTSLDVSEWNTGNVTNMQYMFRDCSSLTSLDVSKWDTGNVTNMHDTFYGCSKLTSLDVSEWNTGNVTNMNDTFRNCSSLTLLDVSKWDTGSVTTIQSMFTNCVKLTSLDMTNWDTGSIFNMSYAFSGCTKIETITTSKNFFRTTQQIDISPMTSLIQSSFGDFANKAKEAYDAVPRIAGVGDGTVAEHREVRLNSVQRGWIDECNVLKSADYIYNEDD